MTTAGLLASAVHKYFPWPPGAGTGIGYEMARGAALGYVFITGGSLLVAAGGVVFGKFVKAVRR